MKICAQVLAATFLLVISCPSVAAVDLSVGPHKTYATIEQAMSAARPSETIVIYPRADNQPYEQAAFLVTKPRIAIRGMPDKQGRRVVLSGQGFEYSGEGKTPRAIFQFEKNAEDCVLDGFELVEAHNAGGNGAGVRINQANNVTIRNCEIHDCDMGIMSNGDGSPSTAANQRIESCLIHDNGTRIHAGYNHNLYLGGTSAFVRCCEIRSSLTGHNLKSRTHLLLVQYCYIHDSANRGARSRRCLRRHGPPLQRCGAGGQYHREGSELHRQPRRDSFRRRRQCAAQGNALAGE